MQSEHIHSYWQRAYGEYHPQPALEGERQVDVIIVGGGYTGLATAWHLKTASPGMTVAVLEAEVIGFGGSGRNGGFISHAFGMHGMTDLRFGRQRVVEGLRYVNRACEYTKGLIRSHSFDCDFINCGFVAVGFTDGAKKMVDYHARDFDDIGVGAKVCIRDRAWFEQEFGSPIFHVGLEVSDYGRVNPIKLAREWKRLALSARVEIYEHTRADRIDTGNRVVITTAMGKVTAEKCVLATNGYTHLLDSVPQVRRKQQPSWSYQIATEPLTAEQWKAIGWKNKQGLNTIRTNLHYFSPTPDGRIVFGGGDIGVAYGRNQIDRNEKVWDLMQFQLEAMFPVLKGVKITDRWGGPVSLTSDLAPVIGTLPGERIIYSCGNAGHGVGLCQLNGKTISDLILEKKTDLTDVWFVNRKPISFPPAWITYPGSLVMQKAVNVMDALAERGVWSRRS
jgi:glycine/D-amino acid oxidase-like deaminating enzyme